MLEIHDYDRIGSNDFLGEVRLSVADLPFDREGRIRPPSAQYKLGTDGVRVEVLQDRSSAKSKKKARDVVTGSLQFRAWKIPSLAECEGVKGFLKHKSTAERASQNKVNTPKVVADEDEDVDGDSEEEGYQRAQDAGQAGGR